MQLPTVIEWLLLGLLLSRYALVRKHARVTKILHWLLYKTCGLLLLEWHHTGYRILFNCYWSDKFSVAFSLRWCCCIWPVLNTLGVFGLIVLKTEYLSLGLISAIIISIKVTRTARTQGKNLLGAWPPKPVGWEVWKGAGLLFAIDANTWAGCKNVGADVKEVWLCNGGLGAGAVPNGLSGATQGKQKLI